jgi:hypothetical protein
MGLAGRTAKLTMLGLVAAGGVFLLPGAAGAADPLYRVDFSFTAIGKERPPNIVESRRFGKGTLSFEEVPKEGSLTKADAASGRIVLVYEVLTPHPRTEQLTLKVIGGSYLIHKEVELATISVEVTDSTSAACSEGANGLVRLARAKLDVVDVALGCGIHEGQRATPGRKSPVRIHLEGACLRPRTSAAVGKPLCSGNTSDEVTLAATIGSGSSGPKKSVPTTKSFGPGKVTIKVSGLANTWPSKTDLGPFSQDALYCFDGCAKFNNADQSATPRLSPLLSVQLPGGGWDAFGHLGPGKYLPPEGGHTYTWHVTAAAKGKISFAFQDTQPDDNTGVFKISIKSGLELDSE